MPHPARLRLWNDFNVSWLALCQKQKDMTQELLQTERQHPPRACILSIEEMDTLGKALIRLCDQMEPHGLVDYEMGIWEDEILSALGQCLDLFENRSEHTRTRPAASSHT
ncbi:hypothetical protein BJY04DRAFT_125745 [Aspergillus karnatakaensis]|uniref:uncharacterized protein n=1 Tax=Aspergillus karnatakaensis TaxID=1810916 RepID=UPI003CCE12FF